MSTHALRLPPATTRTRNVERAIVRAMLLRTAIVYLLFGGCVALLFRPLWQAAETGSNFALFIVGGCAATSYLFAGGLLCLMYIAQLDRWPLPGAPCRLRGVRFTYTWLWAAPGILTQLIETAGRGLSR
jgi:hypothetical protein